MKLNFKTLPDLVAFNIKYYRYLNGYSQEKLAELCKLSPRYLTDIERGIHTPPISKLEVLAASLKVEPYKLLVNDDKDKSIINKMNSSRQYNQK
jgi:DNA-binding helix-turn-helix protein